MQLNGPQHVEGKATYQKRAQTVEPVVGQIKEGLGSLVASEVR